MMGGGAFISLKVDCCRRESAKQPEIRLATLLKILRISRCGREILAKEQAMVALSATFCGIWLIRRKLLALLSRSQF
jgi:hypothetical protein